MSARVVCNGVLIKKNAADFGAMNCLNSSKFCPCQQRGAVQLVRSINRWRISICDATFWGSLRQRLQQTGPHAATDYQSDQAANDRPSNQSAQECAAGN